MGVAATTAGTMRGQPDWRQTWRKPRRRPRAQLHPALPQMHPVLPQLQAPRHALPDGAGPGARHQPGPDGRHGETPRPAGPELRRGAWADMLCLLAILGLLPVAALLVAAAYAPILGQ